MAQKCLAQRLLSAGTVLPPAPISSEVQPDSSNDYS